MSRRDTGRPDQRVSELDHARTLTAEQIVETLDYLADGVVVLDGDWRYRYLNEEAAKVHGRTRDELIGRHIWTVFPEAVGNPFQLAYEEAARERKVVRITDYFAPLGRWF